MFKYGVNEGFFCGDSWSRGCVLWRRLVCWAEESFSVFFHLNCRKTACFWPSSRAGRLTLSGPRSRRQAGNGRSALRWPHTRSQRKSSERKVEHGETVTDGNLDSSSSCSSRAAEGSSGHRPQSSSFRPKQSEGKIRGTAVSYFKGWGCQRWRKGKVLTAWVWKNKSSLDSVWNVPSQWKLKSANS